MINLAGGFTPIPEGVYIFKIVKVEYKEEWGKLNITLRTATGKTHVESFKLIDGNGQPNNGALTSFSYFARTAMNDFDLEKIEEQELVGRYIKGTIEHTVVEGKDGKIRTYAHIADKEPADGYEEGQPQPAPVEVPEEEEDDDLLSSLLK